MELDHQNITFDPFWALNPHIYGIFAIVVFWCFRLPSFESIKSLSWMDLDPPKTYFLALLSSESSLLRHFCDSCLLMFSTVGGQKGSKSDALEEHQKRVEKVNICQKWPKRAQKGPEGVHKGYRFCHFGSLFIVKVTPLVKAVTKGSKLSKMGPKRVQKGPKRVPPRPPFWRS
jgi:hypothetical protein